MIYNVNSENLGLFLSVSDYVSVLGRADTVFQLMNQMAAKYFCTFQYLDFSKDDYDKEYLLTIQHTDENWRKKEGKETISFTLSLEKAYCYEREIYLGVPSGVLLIENSVPDKAITDILNNPFCEDVFYSRFMNFNDDLLGDCGDCSECPDKYTCLVSPFGY